MEAGHDIRWVGAAPLWKSRDLRPNAIAAPDLLRFESDDFMDQLSDLLTRSPDALREQLATPRSYQPRPSGAPVDWQGPASGLRLYQPVHGHFNLVAATLVCRVPGLPDHLVDSARGERAAFLLRRLNADDTELAWVSDPVQGKGWQPLSGNAGRKIAPYEELLPLFLVPYQEQGRRRRLWAGLIPTSSRDTFVAAATSLPDAPDGSSGGTIPDPTSRNPDFLESRARVLEGLQMLTQAYPVATPPLSSTHYADKEREASRFLLLDIADVLERHVGSVWNAIVSHTSPPVTRPKAGALHSMLASNLSAGGNLIGPLGPYLETARAEWESISGASTTPSSLTINLRNIGLDVGTIARSLDEARAEEAASSSSPGENAPGAAVASKATALVPEAPLLGRFDDGDARYVIRCVYQRPGCRPPHADLLSDPSPPFTLASFFDPDAPARPIRIGLPVDTSLKGLRKFRKNVGFLLSTQLRKQMGQATNLKGLIDGKAGTEEPFTIGEICSFSIPLITICAFIVLMIFMILLNFVFWWLPLLKFCFPIPVKR